ncbi:unnamed protein product [Durusdinium trenchii]
MPRVRHRFVVSVKDAMPGDRIFVFGSAKELGGWQMEGARELETKPGFFPKWQVEVEMEQAPFNYKYVRKHVNGGHLEWESIANRTYLKGSLPDDGEFNHNECALKPGSHVYFHGYYAHADWAQQEFETLKGELSELRRTVQLQAKDLEDQRARSKEQELQAERQHNVIHQQKELLNTLQAELEAQKHRVQQLRRELSDFKASAPSAEELKLEIREDLQYLVATAMDRSRSHRNEVRAAFLEPEESEDPEDKPKPPEFLSGPTDAATADSDPKTAPGVVPVTSKEDSSSYYPRKEKPQHDLRDLRSPLLEASTEFIWETPPQPVEEKARRLTQAAVNELMSIWKGPKEEKRKLLKTVPLRLHSDKGGSDEAMTWFKAWKENNEKWYLAGPQFDLASACPAQQPAG